MEFIDTLNKEVLSNKEELKNFVKECGDWFEELIEEAKKSIAKPSFLLPKTPLAKRRRKKVPSEIDDGLASTSTAVVVSPRRTRSTRSTTRGTTTRNLNLEVVPETDCETTSRTTRTKNGGQKTKVRARETQIKQLNEESDAEVLEVTVKRPSDEKLSESQRPSKSRCIGGITEFNSMVPLVENLNFGDDKQNARGISENPKIESVESKAVTTSDYNLHVSGTNDNVQDAITKYGKMVMVPVLEKLSSSVNIENPNQNDNQLSDDTLTDINGENSPVMEKASLSQGKSDRRSKDRCSNETDNSLRGKDVCLKKSLLEEERKSFSFCDDSKVNMSIKESKNAANLTITIESKNQANVTFLVDQAVSPEVDGASSVQDENVPHNSTPRCPEKLEHLAETISLHSPLLPVSRKLSRTDHHSAFNKKSTKPEEKKSAQVFSPYANEPVRERVAAFERLQAVSEERAEPSVPAQDSPVRITRTKTRAMAKAEAAAAAASDETQENLTMESNDAAKNFYSQNLWKAARKSLSKAKKRSIKSQKQNKNNIEESELSKENSLLMSSTKYNTSGCATNRCTPLSSSNISNTNSINRIVGFGSSTGRFPVSRQIGNIVVGVDSFIPKQTVKSNLDDIKEYKEEEIKRRAEKEEETRRKREEALKQRIEAKKRKREEKMMKVLKQREALEKQKLDQEMRQQKEKEEKLKLTMQEREDKMKEQVMQKKQQAQQKAAEVEERRRLEEINRLAKIKEQEEEERRVQALKKKEKEELAKRLAEEKEATALREQQAIKLYQMKMKQLNEMNAVKFKMPQKPGAMNKTFDAAGSSGQQNAPNCDNYGIDSSDCSDDEGEPTRPVPMWGRRENRQLLLKTNSFRDKNFYRRIFTIEKRTPDLKAIFSQYNIKQRKRTSSAVWETPPHFSKRPCF